MLFTKERPRGATASSVGFVRGGRGRRKRSEGALACCHSHESKQYRPLRGARRLQLASQSAMQSTSAIEGEGRQSATPPTAHTTARRPRSPATPSSSSATIQPREAPNRETKISSTLIGLQFTICRVGTYLVLGRSVGV